MQLEPYLFFSDGACEDALSAYTTILGGEVQGLTRFKDMPADAGPHVTPGTENYVMHARFQANGIAFMASDGRPGQKYLDGPISLSLSVETRAKADQIFAAFSEGGKVDMPMQNTFWGSYFGMVTDKFGIDWMISAPENA
ncbi:MAG TPA: VOC family protein [Candidatus Tumulicola sp.]|jgi:PhnB protein